MTDSLFLAGADKMQKYLRTPPAHAPVGRARRCGLAGAIVASVGALALSTATASAQCPTYTTGAGTATFLSGANDAGSACDDCTVQVAFPFTVSFYNVDYSTANVGSNGFIDFTTPHAFGFYINGCLPSAVAFGPVLMAHWDDLRTDNAGGGIFTDTVGTAPNRTFVIEWRAVYFAAATQSINFSVLFYEGQSFYDVVYNNIPLAGASATVGVQNGPGGAFSQFSCNVGGLSSGQSIRFACPANIAAGCCGSDGACSVALPGDCASPSVFIGGSCSPNPCPQPLANDLCVNAIDLAPGGSVTGTNVGATGINLSSCAGAGDTLDVWYRFQATASGVHAFDTLGTAGLDTTLALFDACDGTEIACDDDSAGFPLSRVQASLTNGQTIFVRFAGYNMAEGAFTLNSRIPSPPASNDNCAQAIAVTLPFNYAQDISGSGNDFDLSCNAAASIETVNGVWFSYTPATNQLVRFSETSTVNIVTGILDGTCASFSESFCSDADEFVRPLTAGTNYLILVGSFPATGAPLGTPIAFSMTEVQPPTNDTCGTAHVISAFPYTESVDGSTATEDTDVACNDIAAIATGFGVWYSYTSGPDGGTLNLSETSANNVVIAVFTGTCAGLSEVFCTDPEANVRFTAEPNTTYYFLVGMFSATAVPTSPYTFTAGITLPLGSCCVGNTCTLTTISGCTGTHGGVGTNCGGATGYAFQPDTVNSFQDISTDGAALATISGCDDCGETVALGFTFNFLGTDYTDVWVCSNGFIQFPGTGGPHSNIFTNTPIPTAVQPNGMIAPLWDDFNLLQQGDAYVFVQGNAPNRTVTFSWQNVTQHNLVPPDNNSFQVVLHEGTNRVDFRYGGVTAEPTPGDYTIGYEALDGLSGRSIPGTDIGSGLISITLSNASPCIGGGGSGACCTNASCEVAASGACSGPGTRFVGANTACNAVGNVDTPCCRADTNQDGAVGIQDLFDFLILWFAQAPSANADGVPGVGIQDLFDFLRAWFARCA